MRIAPPAGMIAGAGAAGANLTAAAAAGAEPAISAEPNTTAKMIDVAQVQGQVHAQSVHRVGELADHNPNETASIIRQWLTRPHRRCLIADLQRLTQRRLTHAA